MSQFFIHRPVFAWVIALFIVLGGLLAIPKLPIARYPSVAPPSVTIYATYPGATPQTLDDSVVGPIERELSGVKHLLYFDSSVDASGTAQITATFKPGTDPEMAQVDVQNRLKSVEPRLPQAVRQSGVHVESAASGFLMIVGLTSPDGRFDEVALNDYLARNIVQELRRIDGVGRVQLFGAEQAMRIWVDPAKLTAFGLTMADLARAIEQQNAQIAPGRIGDEPAPASQRLTVPLTVQGQLTSAEAFAAIVLRAGADGAKVVLADVARVELGAQSYAFANRENGMAATSAAVQLAPGANAVRTASAIHARMAELAPAMPAGMAYSIPFDTAPFVRISIEKVVHTLLEAMALVFVVMYVFLQNVRYTLIPAIVAPIALLGTFTVMLLAGFSINTLTMFGMVLAIGIIVDDAIVVVENVERLMANEGLSPRDATSKAMKEITGAVVGITLVLIAVFIPMAFGAGSVGVIYKQFTLSMAVSIAFSAFLALTLTPALCATLLRPVPAGHHARRGVFGAFNRGFERLSAGYAGKVAGLVKRSGRIMLVFAALCVVLVLGLRHVPSSFLPEEDQGYFMTSIQLPTGATMARTLEVVKAFEAHVASRPAIKSNLVVQGFSFAGSGPNAAMAFTMLADWTSRGDATAAGEAALAQDAMAATSEGTVMSLMPPSIEELGTSSGFTMMLQDRGGHGQAALLDAQAQLLKLAAGSQVVADVYPDGLPPGDSIALYIDRAKAEALGLSFDSVSSTLSAAMGSLYVNDFPNRGRMQQVILQADANARLHLEDVLGLRVRNASGGMVPLREVVSAQWTAAPQQMMRFQGFPAVRIAGRPASGASSGSAMAEMERLVGQLPQGYAAAWSGQSLQERQAAAQAPLLVLLSALVVFLVLAALYESWTIPLSVMLVVPLGLLGAVAAVMLRGMPNDVFFKVGMITIIGLSAKNAILIVEFARQLHAEGRSLADAAITAARLRFRPILMTSLAFALGVVPLMLASGASAETQRAIGTGVFGGMVSGTVLAVFFVPAFFVAVLGARERIAAWRARRAAPAVPPV
ncbi:multidrug efflux RND transporter permease subunit [Luteimonas sp. RC10]|uniref:multidrug efflux RND transporter permease subunit n=1 Tax=Luteimonas sp. RC10 TaxID=2587035 RepID=UPI001608CEBA|nr:multidrug efflux RND transporter permease subunit [Luteimonas sp. RC10]MBB3343454.1 multidrug efflux pump [Luteimonas sp. RC10]